MKQKMINRLKRNLGQIKSLTEMIESEKDCEKILIQFQASKAAFDSAFQFFLEANLVQCLEKKDEDKIRKVLSLIIKK